MTHLVMPDVHLVKLAKHLLQLGQVTRKYFFMMRNLSMDLILLISISKQVQLPLQVAQIYFIMN